MAGYTGDNTLAMQKRMVAAMEEIHGVTSAGLVGQYTPLSSGGDIQNIFKDDTIDFRSSNAATSSYLYKISPDYFRAAGTVLLAGRGLSWHDDKNSPRVAVVNQQFARSAFGSVDKVIGRHFKMGDGSRIEIVGVAEDGKYFSLTEEPQEAMFFPIPQASSNEAWLVVRSPRDQQQLIAAMRDKLRGLDPALPLYIQPWTREMNGAFFVPHLAAASLGILGIMGAMLSVTGIFGMTAYSVSKRFRELGIRVALGAQRKEVLHAALARPAWLLALGSLAGLILGIMASRILAFVVYQATPRDPFVLGGAVLIMLLLGLIAAWIPAQKALSINPLFLLRDE
jgi:hypothetical protein